MSSLSERHKEMLEYLFEMHSGYVLGFNSNKDFRGFILLKANIDVYEAGDYLNEPSKAKKFRYFLGHEPDAIVGSVLLDMLDKREIIIERKRDSDEDYIDLYSEYASEIRSVAEAMCSGEAMPSSNQERLNATLLSASEVLNDLISISECACNNKTYNYNQLENSINDYFRDMLGGRGYSQVMDQTRHGISANGNDAGEVDILIKKNNKEVAIIEGLKLNSVNQDYIQKHIDKAIVNYNALGTPTFVIAYVGTTNFGDFWNRYYIYLKDYTYPLEKKESIQELTHSSAAVRCARTILSRDGYDFPVYFMAINIGK